MFFDVYNYPRPQGRGGSVSLLTFLLNILEFINILSFVHGHYKDYQFSVMRSINDSIRSGSNAEKAVIFI